MTCPKCNRPMTRVRADDGCPGPGACPPQMGGPRFWWEWQHLSGDCEHVEIEEDDRADE